MSVLLFVYGTLKRGAANERFMQGQRFVGNARTAPGFRLYEVGGHPGMIRLPDDREGVTGEVWSVDVGALGKLDQFEGVDEGLYRRETVPLLPPFAEQAIEAYVYARSVADWPDIGSTWAV